jgi:hypothetical protein
VVVVGGFALVVVFATCHSGTPSMAIVVGAVRLGYDNKAFSIRRAASFHGIQLHNKNDTSRPRFETLIKRNENLQKLQRKFGPYSPVTAEQQSVTIRIMEANEEVKYTTDAGCYEVVSVIIAFNMSVPYEQRKCDLELWKKGTVIEGKVTDLSQDPPQEYTIKWSSR